MIKRHLEPKLIELARTFPVVTVTGPRQSGKTTLVKWAFPEYDYVSLEDPDEREFATEDPRGFLRRFSKGVVFDEVQKTPHLLSYIQGIVDSNPKAGQFILTGSNQFRLLNKISQSLAGRTAILYLLPFSFREILGYPPEDPCTLKTKKINPQGWSLEEVLFKGFYPPIHDRSLPPHAWLSGYHQTYIERDVREVLNIGNLDTFHRFIRLCATRAGQLLNLSSLAVDAGISHTTARTWLSVLQASFILYTLQPHFANFSKRIIKTPKLYFYDTGLLCYLLRIRTPEELMTHPMKGHIFENFIITEFYKA
ncbi:MAG: ATP-binding protein, partial [Nitrospirae bacterium]